MGISLRSFSTFFIRSSSKSPSSSSPWPPRPFFDCYVSDGEETVKGVRASLVAYPGEEGDVGDVDTGPIMPRGGWANFERAWRCAVLSASAPRWEGPDVVVATAAPAEVSGTRCISKSNYVPIVGTVAR